MVLSAKERRHKTKEKDNKKRVERVVPGGPEGEGGIIVRVSRRGLDGSGGGQGLDRCESTGSVPVR